VQPLGPAAIKSLDDLLFMPGAKPIIEELLTLTRKLSVESYSQSVDQKMLAVEGQVKAQVCEALANAPFLAMLPDTKQAVNDLDARINCCSIECSQISSVPNHIVPLVSCNYKRELQDYHKPFVKTMSLPEATDDNHDETSLDLSNDTISQEMLEWTQKGNNIIDRLADIFDKEVPKTSVATPAATEATSNAVKVNAPSEFRCNLQEKLMQPAEEKLSERRDLQRKPLQVLSRAGLQICALDAQTKSGNKKDGSGAVDLSATQKPPQLDAHAGCVVLPPLDVFGK